MAVVDLKPEQGKKKHVRSQMHRMPDIPPLQNGDHLTREEFERRYNAMPHLKKAELIEGRVYMPSAVRRSHGDAHADVITSVMMTISKARPN